jgi:uncharacterized repeat protein (TIGR01451 family)
MKKIYLIAGLALVASCLVGWAALAWAQSDPGQPGDPVPPVPTMPDPVPNDRMPAPPAPVPPLPNPVPVPPKPAGPGVGTMPDRLPTGVSAPAGPTAGAPMPVIYSVPAPMQYAVPIKVVEPPAKMPATDPAPNPLPPAGPPEPAGTGMAPLPPASGPAPMPPIDGPTGIVPASAKSEGMAMPAHAESRMTEERPAPAPLPDSILGKQEPAVSLEWQGPPTAKLGVPADFTLAVRNTSAIPVQQVLVRVRLPGSLHTSSTEPRGQSEGGVIAWDLGTLQPHQGRDLHVRLVADAHGDAMPQAWVTFTGSALTCVRIREPRLTLKVAAPEKKLLVGDPAGFTLAVSNPGDGTAEQVKIHATLSEGLEHARGSKVDFEVGNLAAGESRTVTLLCATRAGGAQRCEVVAEADGGLSARDAAAVQITAPRIDLQVSGPGLRYLGRKATYTFKIVNPSDIPADNVSVTDSVPEGFKVLGASHGGRHDPVARTVSWFLGEIPPGQSREVQLEVQASGPGHLHQKAAATGARGLHAHAELATRVEGLSALLVELVDTEDPIEVGSETCYEVRVTNTGSKPETDIRLVATVPDQMEFKSAEGGMCHAEGGKALVFDAVPTLAPRAEALFRIHVRALQAGTVRFKIQLTSGSIVEPVIKMESTRIYADTPDTRTGSGN